MFKPNSNLRPASFASRRLGRPNGYVVQWLAGLVGEPKHEAPSFLVLADLDEQCGVPLA
jgi:hypothetical protein